MVHLKDIGAAYSMYAEDHSGWLVIGGHAIWGYELKDYLGLPFPENRTDYKKFRARGTVLECPTSGYPEVEWDGRSWSHAIPLFGGYAFSTGEMGAFDPSPRPQYARKSLHQVGKPTETLVIGDAMNFFDNNPRFFLLYPPSQIPWHEANGYGLFEYTKHREQSTNFMWVDGHVSNEIWEVFKYGNRGNINYYYSLNKPH
jgi:prepilin-type processing-associated H-X9-DG protein